MSPRAGQNLILGVPSKGRLMDNTLAVFAAAGLKLGKSGDERGYRGIVEGMPEVAVEYLSAGEITRHLQTGRIQLGVTGEDLVREQIPDAAERVALLVPLGYGHADVIVAVPACWIDVESMADLEEAAALFARAHGRPLRVATKYLRLTRNFFAKAGVVSYRTVESLGATEGAPAAGMAEAIVDITSTGATLRANGLKVLPDGLILRSQANLVLSHAPAARGCDLKLAEDIAGRIEAAIRRLRASGQAPSAAAPA